MGSGRIETLRAMVLPSGQIELVTDHQYEGGRCSDLDTEELRIFTPTQVLQDKLIGHCSICLAGLTLLKHFLHDQIVSYFIDCQGGLTIFDDHLTPQGNLCSELGFDGQHYRSFIIERPIQNGSLGRCSICLAPLINYDHLNMANV